MTGELATAENSGPLVAYLLRCDPLRMRLEPRDAHCPERNRPALRDFRSCVADADDAVLEIEIGFA